MSDTPRTDLEFPDGSFIEGDECADFARQLERELNEAKTRIEVLEADSGRLVTTLATAYYRLIWLGEFRGRHTLQVQMELASMRDAIAKHTGREPQDVQDSAESAYAIARTALEKS